MASDGVQVPIEFIASFQSALDGITQFASQAGTKLNGIGAGISLVALNAAVEIGEKAFEAFEKVASGLADVISEAAKAEDATNRLGISLKASGDYSQQNVDAFKNLAEGLAETSKFTEDQILGQVALAKQFNITNEEAGKLISASVELAAATGKDLNTAVQQLGQTYEGTAGRLGRVIPSIQQLSREQLIAGDAINIVAKRFQGFSEGELETFNGKIGEAQKAFVELEKAIGEPIVSSPEIKQIVDIITQSLKDLKQAVVDNQGAIVDFVKNGIVILVDSFGVLTQATQAVYIGFLDFKQVVLATAGGLASLSNISNEVVSGFAILKQTIANYKQDSKDIEASKNAFDTVTQAAADLSVKIEQVASSTKVLAKSSTDAATGFDGLVNSTQRFDTQIIEKVKALANELKAVGDTKLDQIQNQYDLQVALIEQAYSYGVVKDTQRLDLENKLRLKYNNEYFDALQAEITKVFQNPASFFTQGNKNPNGSLGLSAGQQTAGAGVAGVTTSILGGASGASSLISSVGSTVGTALLGPLGSTLGPILQQLSAGPAAVKQLVDDFIAALPDLIANIIKAAPAFVIELIRQIPTLIAAIIDELPDVITALIEAVPDIIAAVIAGVPQIIAAIVTKLPEAILKGLLNVFHDIGAAFSSEIFIGAYQFVGKILEGAGNFVWQIIQGAGEFITELVKQISGGIGSKGGLFGTGLFNFSGGGSGLLGGSVIPGILEQVQKSLDDTKGVTTTTAASRTGGTQRIEIPVSIGHSQFARAIVDVKRLGYRLEPI